MSDQSLSRDELASALLDGEMVGSSAADPALTTRVEELRRAADAIGAPATTDDVARERAIAAALAEFDALAAPVTPVTDAAPVRPMERRSRWLPALGAAAAVVLLLVGVVAVTQRDDSSTTDTATAGGAAATIAALSGGATTTVGRGAASNADAAGEAASPPQAPVAASRDLGDIADDEQLRAALGTELFADKAQNAGPDPCEAIARTSTSADLGELASSVTLRFDGQPARALVFVAADGTDHIVVVGDQTCEVLDQID